MAKPMGRHQREMVAIARAALEKGCLMPKISEISRDSGRSWADTYRSYRTVLRRGNIVLDGQKIMEVRV